MEYYIDDDAELLVSSPGVGDGLCDDSRTERMARMNVFVEAALKSAGVAVVRFDTDRMPRLRSAAQVERERLRQIRYRALLNGWVQGFDVQEMTDPDPRIVWLAYPPRLPDLFK